MNKPYLSSYFRGGGLICSTQIPHQSSYQDESITDYDIIRQFFLDFDTQCQNINDLSKSIQSQESQDIILKTIRQIQCQSQFINQASRNNSKIKEYIKQILSNLETLLDCVTNTILSHRFISLQILLICNQISRLIFQYYAHDPIPLDQERQQSILFIIKQLEELLSQGGEQLYYNGIYYELFVIKICIEICPTNSEEGKEVVLNIISGISASLEELSTDLLTSLASGGLYLYKEIKKRKQTNMFKIIFYLEEFKYRIIEKIQQGQGINKIIKQLANNYNILIKDSNEWLIKCSWIKIISDILIYKPIITEKQYDVIKNNHQLTTNWENLIQKRIIKIVDDKNNIAIIIRNDEQSNANRILQQQLIKFQIIQNNIINGEKNLPKLESLKGFSNQLSDTSKNSNQIVEHLQNTPFGQFILQLNECGQKIIKYIELVEDFIEEIQNKNTNQQYLLQQMEQIIIECDEMSQNLYEIILHNNIMYDSLDVVINLFANGEQTNIKSSLLIYQTIQYFKIAKMLDYNFDSYISEYDIITSQLLVQYNLDDQNLEKVNFVQNNQYDVDKLILKLQEINYKNKILITIQDLISYIKMIFLMGQQVQKCSTILIKYKLTFISIRSILNSSNQSDQNNLTYIQDQIPKSGFFSLMFSNYSAIQCLSFIYEQINNNQDILIKQVNPNQEIQQQIGINLNTLQMNHRVQELLETQIIIQDRLKQQSSQINKLDEKIQFLVYSEYIYIYIFRQYKILTDEITQQLQKIEERIKTQKQENPQQQIEDLIKENYNEICQDIDNSKFIEVIQKRIQLYVELQNANQEGDLVDDIQLLELIIEHDKQKFENISKEQIIKIIQNQNERLDRKSQIQSLENTDYSVLQTYQNYLINIKNIVQDLDLYKLQEKSNNLIQDIAILINHIKIQKYQSKQMDEQKSILYNQIVEEFQLIFSIDLEKAQSILQQHLLILQQQDKKLSMDEVKFLIPSFQQLLDRVIDNKSISIKQKALQFINDLFTSEEWRIKDYLYYNCLAFHQYLNENNQKVVGQFLLIARFKETDYRIINTLRGKDQIQIMDTMINNLWEETQDQVNNELQLTLNELQALQLSLQSEERKDVRDQLLEKHKNIEQQLEQQMKNVTEIGDVLGITVYFLKDIKRDLVMIQSKLDNIINSIDQIGQDIKFLRGKTPQQILEIRMQSILQNKIYSDAQSIYVQMKTKEFDFSTNQEKQEQTPLFNIDNQKNGEIDEFLSQNQKSSLLIHGAAGSGKSLTARKIEEYLWLQYQKQCQNKLWSDSKGTPPLIPIFIQLPTLKEPKFNAIEETLLSQLYKFDQKQIDLLKDTAIKNQIKLIFIMDSYDELPQQYQGINLIQTNKIYLWKPQNQLQIPKVITTCRSEAFTTNDYRLWFQENDQVLSLKEVRLLPFDDQQRQDYLKQFSILKLNILIYDLLQVISRKQDRNQILLDTQDIYQQFNQYLYQNLKQENQTFLLDQKSSQILIKIIKANQNVMLFNQEQETAFSKLILGLWHQNLYNNSIQSMDLNQLLETPYMLNIVVEVLPQMNNQASQPNNIKQNFITNYINLTKRLLESTIKIFDLNPNNVAYKPDEVEQFRQYVNNGKQQIQDSQILWECLIEHSFFNNWNVQSSFEDTVSQLSKIQIILNPQLSPINNSSQDLMIIIYKSLKSHKLTLYDFFDKFIEQFVENQRQKLIYSNDILDQNQFELDIYKYATRLSIIMFQRQETIIERKPQGILFRDQNTDPYIQFFEDADQYGNYRKQIRKCIPLNQKGNFYQFRHKSIQEFLFSKECFALFEKAFQVIDLLNELLIKFRKENQQLDLNILEQENQVNNQNKSQEEQRRALFLIELLKQIEICFLNQLNLQDSFNFGALKFIKAKFSQEPDLYRVLYPLILLSSVKQKYTRFSSNCLLIYLQVQGFQSGQDFSRIIISEISLDGAIFENCDLSYSKFDKVSIKGLNINFSDISNCEWNNLYSNDLPSIQVHKDIGCYTQLSPDRKLILSNSQNQNNIQIWDSISGEHLLELQGHTDKVTEAFFSHKGKLLASYGVDLYLRLWDVQTFTQIQEHKLEQQIQRILFSEQDDKIAYQDNDKIYIINSLEKINEVVQIKLIKECLSFKYFDQFIAILICQQGKFYLQQWNFNSGEMIQEQIQETPKKALPHLGLFQKDLLFIAYEDRTIEKWDRIEFKQKGTPFQGHIYRINCIDASKDGKYLVSGGADQLILIYDVQSCNKIQTLIGHRDPVKIVQFSYDGNILISCSNGGLIKFWDSKVNQQLQNSTLNKKLQFTLDSSQLIHLNSQGEIKFTDTETGQPINKKIKENTDQICCMCLHPKDQFILYSTGQLTKIIDLRLMKQVGKTKQTKDKVLDVGYSSDGTQLYLSLFSEIIIYDPNWIQIQKIGHLCYNYTQLSSNYQYLMRYVKENVVDLINFQTKDTFQVENDKKINIFDFGNNNRMFAAVDDANTVTIWNLVFLKNGQKKKLYNKVRILITAIKITPYCNYVIIGALDGLIYTINPLKDYQLNQIESCRSHIRDIIISPCQQYMTAISDEPILNVLRIDKKDSSYSYTKLNIPQKLSSQTLIQELKFQNSTIKSHLGYDLKKIFQIYKENQRSQNK